MKQNENNKKQQFINDENKYMTVADLIKSIIDTSKERIKTPITGAFVFSFIIYNWRPISILFSDLKIQERIELIDGYLDVWSLVYPILMALVITIIVPFFMWGIDSILIYAKKKRLEKNYENRTNVLAEKIKIATKVLELKNAESGNKEKQDLLDQINYLESSQNQLKTLHKNEIDQINLSLQQANDSLHMSVRENEQNLKVLNDLRATVVIANGRKKELEDKGRQLYKEMAPRQRQNFEAVINQKGEVDTLVLDAEDTKELADLLLIEGDITKTKWILTDLGQEVYIYMLFKKY
ncbi:hypothetical protein [Flavobacterium sp. LC2016-12]|uniref:hypothetical protein n=1 Tax=Flavobacterium sp. LC2016-12 TaxID=2783794 RepID=UPI00188A5264|nr:hypothetical protein [Flavobacterium sp. LC2016-12]MBF4466405.1 hypothetical protein [Flavobacterium sp. LC2016-12]